MSTMMYWHLILIVFIFPNIVENIDELSIDDNVLYLRNVLRPTGVLKFSLSGLKEVKAEFKAENNSIGFIRDGSQSVKLHKTRKRFNHTVEYEFVWFNATDKEIGLEVCFHYGYNNARWYSTLDEHDIHWNASTDNPTNNKPLVTGYPFGAVMEYLFVNTDGFAIMLDHQHPWFIERQANDPTREPLLCLSLDNRFPYPHKTQDTVGHPEHYYSIRFKILTSTNIRTVHQAAILDHRYIDTPKKLPDLSVMQNPSWNTQSFMAKRPLNVESVTQFGQLVGSGNYSRFLLVIDGNDWQTRTGSLTFKPNFFDDKTNATFMMDKLAKLGFKVSLYISVYVEIIQMVRDETYMIKKTNSVIGHKCDAIDFTNQHATESYLKRLNDLGKNTGVYTFKFVQGDVYTYGDVFYGNCAFENGELVGKYPNLLSTINGATNSQLGSAVEIETAFRVQRFPLFVKTRSKKSGWDAKNGLKSELIDALTMSIAGYSFIKSDIICGNGNCTDELFIRWMQAVTFFPAIQFSIPPWTMENVSNVINITKELMKLRAQFMPRMIYFSNRVVQFGEPMIRPMWYEAPDDPLTYDIWDQYMLGSELLVAPVVDKGKIKRDVYLPYGLWRDQHNKYHVGPKFETISAPLEEPPYFVRV